MGLQKKVDERLVKKMLEAYPYQPGVRVLHLASQIKGHVVRLSVSPINGQARAVVRLDDPPVEIIAHEEDLSIDGCDK